MKLRSTIPALMSGLMLLALTLLLATPAPACAARVTTGPAGTSYYQARGSSGWGDLLTPPHYADGQTAYCLNMELDYPVGQTYGAFDPASLYNPTVQTGLEAILYNGYPYTTGGLSPDEARYATANAIRAWLHETTGVGYNYMDLRGYDPNNSGTWSRLRPKAGYTAAFQWTLGLVGLARAQWTPVFWVGGGPVHLTPNADYSRLEGWVQINSTMRGPYAISSVTPGVTITGATGLPGEWVHVSTPCDASWLGRSITIALNGYDDRLPANLFWWAPGGSTYQSVTAVADPGRWLIGGSGVITADSGSGDIRLVKSDATSSTPLPGASFELYWNATRVATGTTDPSGVLLFTGLAPGTWTVRETGAPAGYVLDVTPHTVTVLDSGTADLTVSDARIRGTVRIHKHSAAADGRALAGATYEIWRTPDTGSMRTIIDPESTPTAPAAVLTTDASGTATSGLLDYGVYYAVETSSPVGFALDAAHHYFEIRADGAVVEISMTDPVLPIGHGGVMLRYRNVWDSTEIAKAWGYNAAIGKPYLPRIRAEKLDAMPIKGFTFVRADYPASQTLIDGKLVVTYWYRRTVSGGWSTVKTGDAGTAPLSPKQREMLGLLADGELYNRLEAARRLNPDVVGYLSIPGTSLHEPVVVTTDNLTYLSQNAAGASDPRGAIMMDYACDRYVGCSSRYTLLWGHDMRDGSMFGFLAHYADPTFWRAHPYVQYIDGAGNGGTWRVYSARIAGEHDDALAFPAASPYAARVGMWAKASALDPGFTPDSAGRTLTLATCAPGGASGRKFIVHAELLH
jgi:SrtB family sortase